MVRYPLFLRAKQLVTLVAQERVVRVRDSRAQVALDPQSTANFATAFFFLISLALAYRVTT
jgi:hypothetical protein